MAFENTLVGATHRESGLENLDAIFVLQGNHMENDCGV